MWLLVRFATEEEQATQTQLWNDIIQNEHNTRQDSKDLKYTCSISGQACNTLQQKRKPTSALCRLTCCRRKQTYAKQNSTEVMLLINYAIPLTKHSQKAACSKPRHISILKMDLETLLKVTSTMSGLIRNSKHSSLYYYAKNFALINYCCFYASSCCYGYLQQRYSMLFLDFVFQNLLRRQVKVDFTTQQNHKSISPT